MKKQSIFYKYPFFYKHALKLIHGKNLKRRYRVMANFIKEKENILEPACGLASFADFLPKKSFYSGFDLNTNFIKYIQKKHKNFKIFVGDILSLKNYSPVDVIVICDVLHHLKPDDRKLFLKNCFKVVKKRIIICEPKGKEKFVFGKKFFDYFEQDGINEVKAENFWTEKKLKKEIKDGFNVIPNSAHREIQEIGKDIICVFFKEKNLLKKNS